VAHRVIDERTAIPGHFTSQELEAMYEFEPDERVDQAPIEIEDDPDDPHNVTTGSQHSTSAEQRATKVVY
jgi:hypothetical protein